MRIHEYDSPTAADALKATIRDKYGQAALGERSGCCGSDSCCDPITADLYSAEEKGRIPGGALTASLGCGNPPRSSI